MTGTTRYKNVFKWISFGLLILVVTTTLLSMGWQVLTDNLVQYGVISGDSLKVEGIDSITGKIYSFNGILSVLSIISGCIYLFILYQFKDSGSTYTSYSKRTKRSNKKTFDFKGWFKRFWPGLLLVAFMGWTAVGCIQASTEAAAEAFLRTYEEEVQELQKEILTGSAKEAKEAKIELEELNKKYEKNKEIADWSSTDRMPNAADRGWNGCNNLKDGYWSFIFYGMVVVNVIMLGANTDNLKKWILRVLLVSGFLLVFISFCTLLDPVFFGGSVRANRAIFNNSNHYGYYLCIITMLSATMFIKDKNISVKLISLISFVLTSFMLVINNTFGAYLGVMIALGIMFICSLLSTIISIALKSYYIKIEGKEEKDINKAILSKVSDFAKVSVIVLIFGFFSCTITGSESKIYLEDKYVCQKSYIGATFGERSILFKNMGYTATKIESTFEMSGDNRLYSNVEKNLDIVEENDKLDKDDEVYLLNGHYYKVTKTETSNSVKTPKEYSNTTIVERNFEQLFKDIGIIFASNNGKEDNKNEVIENIVSGEAMSGELKNNEIASGEYNEKSGLSEEVSNTGSGRGEVWIKSLDLIEQRPLFGWGLENMLNEFYYQYGVNEGRTHNLILQLAGTTGIVGMLLYISAVVVIFFKVLFEFKFRNYKIEVRSILIAISVIMGIVIYAIMQKVFGIMLISVMVAYAASVFLALIVNIKSMKLKMSKWGLIEYVTVPTFIAYMISALFGNSAFYTSPYFMVILGMMIASLIYSKQDKLAEDVVSEEDNGTIKKTISKKEK